MIGKAEIFTLQIQYTDKQPSFQTQWFPLGDRLQIEQDRDPRYKGERGTIYKPCIKQPEESTGQFGTLIAKNRIGTPRNLKLKSYES